jgi:CRP-like cAMP-binding protein
MDNKKSNILRRINSGLIGIESVSDFEELLNDFPEDPALHKAYGNLLVKNDSLDEAALSYGKSATLYLKSGKLPPAIVTKLLQWRIKSPDYQDVQLFLTALNDNSLPDTPLKVFFQKLSKPELLAVIKCIEYEQFSAGQLIYKIEDVQEALYFIVSGSIKEIRYEPIKTDEQTVFKQSVDSWSADDTFGEIYPIKKENVCQSLIETTEPTEMLKISKQMLLPLCKKYSNIESGLQAVRIFRSDFRKAKLLKKKRKGQRHEVMRKISLEIFPHTTANSPIILKAYSKDISIGGTCVILDANDLSIAKSVATFSKTIRDSKVKISLPCEGMELKVSGKIAWTQETIVSGELTLAVGIQFQNLSPKLRGMIFVFADNQKK